MLRSITHKVDTTLMIVRFEIDIGQARNRAKLASATLMPVGTVDGFASDQGFQLICTGPGTLNSGDHE